ncbi:unnamed protein product [Schistosoma curassoni]|nr:unnamed protein product [Schistosoma curassoni]
MLRTLNSNTIDWMLPTGDIKAAFNDIPTGHTPTYTTDDSYRDFSKWENLNTPTPLDKESDNYFIYPPNPVIKVEPSEDEQIIQNRDNSQLLEVQYLKPLTTNRNDQTVTQPQIQSPLVYLNLESHPNPPNTEEMKLEILNETVSLESHMTPVKNYNSDTIFNHWSTDSLLHSTKFNTDTVSSNYRGLYDNAYTISENHTPWSTYQTNDIVIIPNINGNSNNNGIISDQRSYVTPESVPTCSTCSVSNKAIDNKFDFNQCKSEYCYKTIQTESKSIHNKCQKLSDQQKPFICGISSCNKRFVRIDELKRHQRTHSGIKQFICDICEKGFTRSDHLMTHRRTHTGERPYECKICDRRFARSDERNRHTKTHMRDKPRRGRKPRNASIPSSTTLSSSSSSKEVVVSTNFPNYNVHPYYSMPLDQLSFVHRNTTNNNNIV